MLAQLEETDLSRNHSFSSQGSQHCSSPVNPLAVMVSLIRVSILARFSLCLNLFWMPRA